MSMSKKTVLLFGDFMLDKYMYGTSRRLAYEHPVPVVDIDRRRTKFVLGGAGNVLRNLQSFDYNVIPMTVVGDNCFATILREQLIKAGVDTQFLVTRHGAITTLKNRVYSDGHHISRFDIEDTREISVQYQDHIYEGFMAVRYADAVVFQDYNKGQLPRTLITKIIKECNRIKIPVFVDPSYNNFNAYQNVTVFKPNLKEAIAGIRENGLRYLQSTALLMEQLHKVIKAKIHIITLGAEGARYTFPDGESFNHPLKPTEDKIVDGTGAGDTMLAALVYAALNEFKTTAAIEFACLAATQACTHEGTHALTDAEVVELTK